MSRYSAPSVHPLCGTLHWSLGLRATECPPREEWFTGRPSFGPPKAL